jgi:ribosomal-protein-alanine N-acetyltransferase
VNAVAKPSLPQLRPMRESDLDAVDAIEAVAYPFPWSPGIFRDCMRAGYECWAYEDGETVIGYGVLSVAAGEAHLLNVCIAPQRQGTGLGRRLVSRMIDLARWQRAERVFLEVRPSNVAALALYLDMGFAEVGRRKGYYPAAEGREDAIVMALELLGDPKD